MKIGPRLGAFLWYIMGQRLSIPVIPLRRVDTSGRAPK